MQRKLVRYLIFLGLAHIVLAHEECDSSVGHCQGDSHSMEEEENKYKEEVNAFESGTVVETDGGVKERRRDDTNGAAAAEQDAAYREMFDKDGLFNRDLAKEYLDKDDYEQVFGVHLVSEQGRLLKSRWKRLLRCKSIEIEFFLHFDNQVEETEGQQESPLYQVKLHLSQKKDLVNLVLVILILLLFEPGETAKPIRGGDHRGAPHEQVPAAVRHGRICGW